MRRWLSRLLGRQEMRERLMGLESQVAQLSAALAALRSELAASRASEEAAQRRMLEAVAAQVEDATAAQTDRLDGYLVHHVERLLATLPLPPAGSGSVASEERGRPVGGTGRSVDFSRG